MNGAALRIDYAKKRLKKIHAELLAIGEQLDKPDLPRPTRELLTKAKRSKVLTASRWAQMITELEEQGSA
jgi:hypothetical protein